MYKRFLLAGVLAMSLSLTAQRPAGNTLLTPNFWRAKPSIESLQAEIARGNNPAESNARTMDVVTIAIQQDAPTELIQYLIGLEGNSVHKQTHHYRTYLHWAAARGNVALVRTLIALGSDVNALDEHGNTPLMYALGNGVTSTELIETMQAAGYDLTQRHRSGATLMMLAIGSDRELKLADYLTRYGLSLMDKDTTGATLFDYAVRSGDVAQLRLLLGRGVKPTKDAILMAARGSRRSANGLDVYRFLIEELGQDPLRRDADGNTLLHLVAGKGGHQLPIVQYLIALGIDPRALNEEGNNAFLIAAAGRDMETLSYLLPLSDANLSNQRGETALTRAIQSSTPATVEYLVSRGADVHVLDLNGYNLLYHLAQSYRDGMPMPPGMGGAPAPRTDDTPEFTMKLQLLALAGLSPATSQPDGSTLYHYAASRGSLAMLEQISDLGIDINAVNEEGLTALHKASLTARDTAILRKLVALGADKSIRTDLDETAYDLARENGYLKALGADINFLK